MRSSVMFKTIVIFFALCLCFFQRIHADPTAETFIPNLHHVEPKECLWAVVTNEGSTWSVEADKGIWTVITSKETEMPVESLSNLSDNPKEAKLISLGSQWTVSNDLGSQWTVSNDLGSPVAEKLRQP